MTNSYCKPAPSGMPESLKEYEAYEEYRRALPIGFVKPDTDKQVFFYEQDFYVLSNFSAFNLVWRGYLYPPSPDSGVVAEVKEAFEWLHPRGYLECAKDERGEYVKVLPRPGEAR